MQRLGSLQRATSGGEIVPIVFDEPPTTDLLTYVSVKCQPKEYSAAEARDLPPPVISIPSVGDRSYRAVIPVGPVEEGDLVVFKGLPSSDHFATVLATGATWQTRKTRVALTPGILTVTSPLELVPAGALSITASAKTMDWLTTLAKNACPDAGIGAAPVLVELVRAGSVDQDSVRQIAADTLVRDGQVVFEQLPVGRYELRVSVAGYKSLFRKSIVVKTGSQAVEMTPDLYQVSGVVTRQGRPVRANVQIVDVSVTTDLTGRFAAYLPTGTTYDRVRIVDCETSAQFVIFPSDVVRLTNILNVELPSQTSVRVVDRKTSRPVGDALVTVSVPSKDDPQMLLFHEGRRTDERGYASLTTTPVAEFSVCAEAAGYSTACDQATKNGETLLRLSPEDASTGTIRGVAPVIRGVVLFTTPHGVVTETVAVAEDGTFTYSQPHVAGEFIAFVSGNRPLYLLPLPTTVPLVIDLPPARMRSLQIAAKGDDDCEIGLAIGDRIVPSGALSRHQAARGGGTFTVAGRLLLTEIAETAPLTIYRGFSLSSRPSIVPESVDAFARPELLATFPRQVVPEGSDVVVLP